MTRSEFRQDIVSGDWILIAPGRRSRPQQFVNRNKPKHPSKKGCIFENPAKAGGGFPIIVSPPEAPFVQVVPNKFPAVTSDGTMPAVAKRGPFSVIPGVGHHDLVITKYHDKNFPALLPKDAKLLFDTLKQRYKMLADDPYVAYISIFHNWGPNAGASIYHPHYQIVTVPIVPPTIQHSLSDSAKYYRTHHRCVYCATIKWEKRRKRGIIFENDEAIAFAPFASRRPFEVRIFPKRHLPFFEETGSDVLGRVAEALQESLRMIERKLGHPDYNFFLYPAPTIEKGENKHYHWHIEIQPKVQVEGGFELNTGIEINIVDPDMAAKFLRK